MPVNVRLLAATQAPLPQVTQVVEDKHFRGDLYARLDGFTLKLPPLRELVEEVPLLFRKLLAEHGGANAPSHLDPLMVERLCFHDWPFNVRELTLVARKLLALYPDAAIFDCDMLPERLRSTTRPAARASIDRKPSVGNRDREERGPDAEMFLAVLRANSGNVKRTAAAIGISRSRAYRLMEQMDAVDLGAIRQNPSGRLPPGG